MTTVLPARPIHTVMLQKTLTALTVGLVAAATLSSCAPQAGTGQSSLVSPQPERTAVLRAAPDPQSLIGVPPQTVRQHLGSPAFDGSDGEARIWRYSGSNCALLVIFYPEEDGAKDGGMMKSSHLDARKLEGGATPIGPCLREVVNTPGA